MKQPDKGTYFENLNGLRFIAFLSVFVGHSFVFNGLKIESHIGERIVGHFFLHGDLGVNFFFVLSGFLITFLLQKEKTEKASISIKKFYMRRILRIWPVYFLTVGIGFFLIPFVFRKISLNYLPFPINIPLSKMVWYAGFFVNFDMVFHGASAYLLIVVLWSISVEEQYYLIWPLINKITSKYILVIVLGLLFILSYYYRWAFYYDKTIIKYSTFSVMNDLIIGSAIGLYSFRSGKFKNIFIEMKKWVIYLMYIILIVCIPMQGFIYYFPATSQFLVSLDPLIFALIFAFIILEQSYARNSFFKISDIKLFDYLGRISYGLYCYHMIFIFLIAFLFNLIFGKYIQTSFLIFIFETMLSFLLTVFFSHISYKFFEGRFLKFKDRYKP